MPTSPGEADTVRMRAEKALQKQQLGAARAGFEACLAHDEAHAHDHYQLGRVLLKLSLAGDETLTLDRVKRHFARAAEIEPGRVDYFMALGDLAKREGDARTALGFYRKVLSLDSKHHGARRELRLYKRREAESAHSATARLKAMFTRARDKPAKGAARGKAKKGAETEEIEVEFT